MLLIHNQIKLPRIVIIGYIKIIRHEAMQSINALSLPLILDNWLTNLCHPHILHVFDHACNLIDDQRNILSIVTPHIGNGPFNLVIEDDILFSDHLAMQSAVSIHNGQIDLGDLTINTANAHFWPPRPNWETLHARRDDILNQIMSLRGQWSHARSNSPANFEIAHLHCTKRSAVQVPSQRALLTTISSITNSLTTTLAIADLPAAITATRQLAGLGQGLTPAGDDFIMGALYASWIIHPPEIAKTLAGEITNAAAPLTTSLSAAYLKSAGKGEAGILWHNFFNSLLSGGNIQLPIIKLLSIGHTSGADALAGFISTIISHQEAGTKLCPS